MTPPFCVLSQNMNAQPAGAVADEAGKNTCCVVGSTATECALFPVAIDLTTVRLAASMTCSVGVHGDAAVHAVPDDRPLLVQRLAAR